MRGIIPFEERQEKDANQQFGWIELAETEQQQHKHPYDSFNEHDKHLIGKPADKACLNYVYAFIDQRDANIKSSFLLRSYLGFAGLSLFEMYVAGLFGIEMLTWLCFFSCISFFVYNGYLKLKLKLRRKL